MLKFNYKTITGTLLISPIQPLDVMEIKEWVVLPIDSEIALEIAKKLEIKITKQNLVGNVVKSFSGKLGTVTVTIPIYDAEPLSPSDIKWEEGINYPEINSSFLDNYNKYKKLSRYIIAYMLWLYSRFIYENDEQINEDSILKFGENFIIIIPDFEYKPVSKTFDLQSGVMSEGKLVVKSEESLKRLIYVLKISCMDTRKIIAYRSRIVIENYYSDVTDFDQHQSQVILQGSESIDKWISEYKKSYVLYSKILIKHQSPYFFQNNLIGPEIWLVQNTSSIEKAINIWKTWNKDKYNPGENPNGDDPDIISFMLYSYHNSQDIVPYKIGKESNIKILGYKIEGNNFYTVLLPLT